MDKPNFIFGYGSLVDIENLKKYFGRDLTPSLDFIYCGLKDFHRCWNIAMNNSVDLPDYKYYIDQQTGNRPEGFVTFLNIRPCPGDNVTGILFRVSDQELQRLDKRERNYRRIDVTHLIDTPIQGQAWVYIGLDEAEKRYQKGLKQNTAMVSQNYFDSVYNAYLSLGNEALSNYFATTDELRVPIFNLEMRIVVDTPHLLKSVRLNGKQHQDFTE